MNVQLRKRAENTGMAFLDYILLRMKELQNATGVNRTIISACPNSITVIRASLKSAKRANAPIKFAATLNQVDTENAYTGLNHKEFVAIIREQARELNVTVPVIIAIDHGGPWLKDIHKMEKWTYAQTMDAVKKSFEAAVEAGFDLIHVDPTIDITLPKNEIISIELVAERTIELIEHTEHYRKSNGFPRIAYEVGTEEVHGGLADISTFKRFLTLIKEGLAAKGLADVWPSFVVGKVGTDLHTTTFDPVTAEELTRIAGSFGSLIKGHYSDNVSNPEAYPKSGMGAANVGPEFTECEYDGLMELVMIEEQLFSEGKIARRTGLKKALWEAVIASNRWQKWLSGDEDRTNFYSNSPERQQWLIKTGCRYVWENPEVVSARFKLYKNLEMLGIEASLIVESRIERALDKYFHSFNLMNLNDQL